MLKKVAADYDAHDRLGAMSFLQQHAAKGQIVTGLLYVDREPEDLHAPFQHGGRAAQCAVRKGAVPGLGGARQDQRQPAVTRVCVADAIQRVKIARSTLAMSAGTRAEPTQSGAWLYIARSTQRARIGAGASAAQPVALRPSMPSSCDRAVAVKSLQLPRRVARLPGGGPCGRAGR